MSKEEYLFILGMSVVWEYKIGAITKERETKVYVLKVFKLTSTNTFPWNILQEKRKL